jgi:putative tryptophan/tyrosine transport system substrate-binding protein
MKGHMRRRDFITGLGGAAAAWPLAARAQRPAMPAIGYLSSRTAETDALMLAAFREGLSAAGYVEGRNVTIEYRFADGAFERNAPLAADLVRRQVAVIVTAGNVSSAMAAKTATSTIPIVFNSGVDPVQAGLVASINRPGGNLTGVFAQAGELVGKMMGLLHELVPNARNIGLLVNPRSSLVAEADARRAAAALGLEARLLNAGTDAEIEASFASMAQRPVDAMVVPNDPLFLSRAGRIVALAAEHALPTIYGRRPYVDAGGLISYGDEITSGYRQMGLYAGRILKGEKPADLPVVLTDRFELVINLKTAMALGLTVPPTLLAIADQVIEQ